MLKSDWCCGEEWLTSGVGDSVAGRWRLSDSEVGVSDWHDGGWVCVLQRLSSYPTTYRVA